MRIPVSVGALVVCASVVGCSSDKRSPTPTGPSTPSETFQNNGYVVRPPPGKLPWPQHRPDMNQAEYDAMMSRLWLNDLYGSLHDLGDSQYFYVHDGIDVMLDDTTPLFAMEDGVVAVYAYECVYVRDNADPTLAWEYAHVDNVQVQPGQAVRQGDFLCRVARGRGHTHISRVRLIKGGWGAKQNLEYMHPGDRWVYTDTRPPEIATPFVYFPNESDTPFGQGLPVSGEVDIVVGVRDRGEVAGIDQVPWPIYRVEYDIVGPTGVVESVASWDFGKVNYSDWPGNMYEDDLHLLYKSHLLPVFRQLFGETANRANYCFLILTNTDGTGQFGRIKDLRPRFSQCAWNTRAIDVGGRRKYPDGVYTVTVRASDLYGNTTRTSETVVVRNGS